MAEGLAFVRRRSVCVRMLAIAIAPALQSLLSVRGLEHNGTLSSLGLHPLHTALEVDSRILPLLEMQIEVGDLLKISSRNCKGMQTATHETRLHVQHRARHSGAQRSTCTCILHLRNSTAWPLAQLSRPDGFRAKLKLSEHIPAASKSATKHQRPLEQLEWVQVHLHLLSRCSRSWRR